MGPHESLSRGGELTHLGIIDRVGKTMKICVCADKCKTCEGVAVLCSRLLRRLSHRTHRSERERGRSGKKNKCSTVGGSVKIVLVVS